MYLFFESRIGQEQNRGEDLDHHHRMITQQRGDSPLPIIHPVPVHVCMSENCACFHVPGHAPPCRVVGLKLSPDRASYGMVCGRGLGN